MLVVCARLLCTPNGNQRIGTGRVKRSFQVCPEFCALSERLASCTASRLTYNVFLSYRPT